MNARLLPAAVAVALMTASAAAMAAETSYPRAYSAEDCPALNGQIDDSIKFSNVDAATMAMIQAQRARADRACNSGQYGAGTRQLRDILDEVIASRGGR